MWRIWRRCELQPHLEDYFKLSTDPQFVEKVVDVVVPYHNPSEKAVVLCVNEKSQMQALDHSQPVLPMMPERRSHDYAGHGVTSLHLVCDSLATHETPAIRDWLARHPSLPPPLHPDPLVLD